VSTFGLRATQPIFQHIINAATIAALLHIGIWIFLSDSLSFVAVFDHLHSRRLTRLRPVYFMDFVSTR